jgi:hypothetical protein
VSADEHWLATMEEGPDRGVFLFSVTLGKLLSIPNPYKEDRVSPALSRDGRWLAYASRRQRGSQTGIRVRSVPPEAGGPADPVDVPIADDGRSPVCAATAKKFSTLHRMASS